MRTRSEAFAVKISLAFTLCKIAEDELRVGHVAQAHKVLRTVRETAEFLRFHIDIPRHLSPDRVQELRNRLDGLNNCISQTEKQTSLLDPKAA
jgi:hypothetical protein